MPTVSMLTNSELADLDSFNLSLLLQLLPLEPRTHRIYSSETILPHEYYHKFNNLEDLIEYKHNILDHYNKFSVFTNPCWLIIDNVFLGEEACCLATFNGY
jgi:hypothetical protein